MENENTVGGFSEAKVSDSKGLRNPKDALIVALDGDENQAREWAAACLGVAGWVKVGMTLFYKLGADIVEDFLAMGYKVFLDLKLHDIPHQVEGAAYVLGKLGVGMLTVHASGGPEMIAAARRGTAKGAAEVGCVEPIILAVTVLTSMNEDTMRKIGYCDSASQQVERLARLAIDSGATGIVCSPLESSLVREAIGEGYAIVTPGVRPNWAATDDQSRIMTPTDAIAAGSTHLVVGRPITAHVSPIIAARLVVAEIADALRVNN